jgi:hypothetical protein
MTSTTVQLTGAHLTDSAGVGVNGSVELVLSTDLLDSVDTRLIKASRVKADVVDGVMIPVDLVPNDLLTPTSVYTVTHNFRGMPLRTYTTQILQSDGPSVDIVDKTPVLPPSPLPGLTVTNSGVAGQILVSAGGFEVEFQDESPSGGALTAVNNLSDVDDVTQSRLNLGLGSAALQPSSAFDAAGSASTAQTAAQSFATTAVGVETARAEAAESLKIATASAGVADGVATLDGSGHLPVAQAAGIFSRQIHMVADGVPSSVVAPVGVWTPTYLMASDTGGVWSGWINISDSAQNDSISFDLACGAGTYTLELLHLAYLNRGIYTIKIDGVTVGSIDGYNTALTPTRGLLTGVVIAAGQHTVTLLMATQNASASGYVGLIERLTLTRTA